MEIAGGLDAGDDCAWDLRASGCHSARSTGWRAGGAVAGRAGPCRARRARRRRRRTPPARADQQRRATRPARTRCRRSGREQRHQPPQHRRPSAPSQRAGARCVPASLAVKAEPAAHAAGSYRGVSTLSLAVKAVAPRRARRCRSAAPRRRLSAMFTTSAPRGDQHRGARVLAREESRLEDLDQDIGGQPADQRDHDMRHDRAVRRRSSCRRRRTR